MICVVIKGPTYGEARHQITQALPYADLIELRLDYFNELDIPSLKELRKDFTLPMIFTLRSPCQGGSYPLSEDRRLMDICTIASLKPEYLDLESYLPLEFSHEISTRYPEIKIIVSYHDFTHTPEDIECIYQQLKKTPAYLYKIATKANSPIDAMRLLCWTKNSPKNVIAISMGEHGQITRILGPVVGSKMSYACLDEEQQSAPGQLSAKELKEKYRYHTLNSTTAIYGLIGDPISRSISDTTHNELMGICGLNAVYVKIQVTPQQLPEFLLLATKLPFQGLSVTMPLKECLLPCLDSIDPQAKQIGAANTILIKDGKLIGFNTDGLGALNAIEKELSVKGKRVVIIGAGGAAKAVIYEACRRKALVTIVNRDAEKARKVADYFGCEGFGLDHMASLSHTGYDILINCTPVPMPIDPSCIIPQAYVMDITTRPVETVFIKNAKEKSCRLIYGYRMFVEQAVVQFELWMKEHIPHHDLSNILEQQARATLEIT